MANFDSISEGDVRVIKFADTQILDESYCHSISCELMKIVNNMNESALLINLGSVKYMASAMIGKLVLLRNHCKTKAINFSICSLDENVLDAIQLMKIDSILNVHSCQDEAISELQS